MVSNKRYMPTNKRFQDHTKKFVGTKTKKGHLDPNERSQKDVVKEDGYLVRVIKQKINEDGWEVKVGEDKDAKTYMCTYGDNILYLPDYTETAEYYVPKNQCEVEVSIDSKSKIYTITRMKDPTKKPITIADGKITLQTNDGNAAITVNETNITAIGEIVSNSDIKITTSDGEDDISLGKLHNDVQGILNDGLETTGDIIVKNVDDDDISLSVLYNKVKSLEEKINNLE